MPELSDLEHKGLVQAFCLQSEEVADARYNLLGFFGVLYKIDQRLKKEAQGKTAAKEAGRD